MTSAPPHHHKVMALLIAILSMPVLTAVCQEGDPKTVPSSPARNAATSTASGSLATSLGMVQGDQSAWNRCCLFAFGVEVGIPEQRLKEAWPGAKLDLLPAEVLATLRQGSEGIPAWIACLKDHQPTGVVENDLFGGGSSEKAKKLTCHEAALSVLLTLTPSSLLNDLPTDDDGRIEKLQTVFVDWEKLLRPLSSIERMQEWFKRAGDDQRRMFLAIVIQTQYAPAYTLLEESFLKRAVQPDGFFVLEVSAYIRHRRDAAKAFLAQIEKKIGERPVNEDEGFHLEMWRLLTQYGSMEPAIQDWLADRIDIDKLATLLDRSIDQPWAYHSMPIEPTAVHRAVVEVNLRSLVSAAHREHEIEKRMKLLELASHGSDLLKTVIYRTSGQERRPSPRSDSPEWKGMVEEMRELLTDSRISAGTETVVTPSEKAAKIIWHFWGPGALDTTRRDEQPDWRTSQVGFADGSCRSLIVDGAKECFANLNGVAALPFPKEAAALLMRGFTTGNALAWRQKLSSLR